MSVVIPISLPESLAERAARNGILEAETMLRLIETAVVDAETRAATTSGTTPPIPAWLEALGMPTGAADIEIEFPRMRSLPRDIDLK